MRTFRDDYPDIVDQLVDLFLESTPPLLEELRSALDGDDDEELRRAAHKLKGSCQNIGATFMATLCKSLEQARRRRPRDAGRARRRTGADRSRDPPGTHLSARAHDHVRRGGGCGCPVRPRTSRAVAAAARARAPLRGARCQPARRLGDALRPRAAIHAARRVGYAAHGWRREDVEGRLITDVLPAGRADELLPHCRAALRGEPSAHDWAGVREAAHRS